MNKKLLTLYTKVDGIPTFKDSEIKNLWLRTQTEGFVDSLFFNMEKLDANDFLEEMQLDTTVLFIMRNNQDETCGFAWLNNIRGGMFDGHFALFKGFRGEIGFNLIKRACEEVLHIKAFGKYVFDVLVGVTPSSNMPACALMRRIQAGWDNSYCVQKVKNYLYDYDSDSLVDAQICYLQRNEA